MSSRAVHSLSESKAEALQEAIGFSQCAKLQVTSSVIKFSYFRIFDQCKCPRFLNALLFIIQSYGRSATRSDFKPNCTELESVVRGTKPTDTRKTNSDFKLNRTIHWG